uniref:Protein ARV n=2 Tax=Macrostomum lignano TaxID=282301 RepID=A0A1I8H7A9_9PLAT
MQSSNESKPKEANYNDYICVECGSSVSSLYTKYSADVVQLAKCKKCGQPADRYIECDRLLLALDILLHRLAAMRHLLHNHRLAHGAVWRGLLLLVICEAYALWLEARDLDSDLSAAVFSAAKEMEFYAKLLVSTLQTASMILAILSNEFVNRGSLSLHKTAKLVLVAGCCRAMLLPLLAWRSTVGFDLFFWLSFLLSFSITLTGLLALRPGQALHLCLLEAVLACNCSRFTVAMLADAVLSKYGVQLGLTPSIGMFTGGLRQHQLQYRPSGYSFTRLPPQPRPPPFIPKGYEFFLAA